MSAEEQIEWMLDNTNIPSDVIWSMFERLS